MRERISRKDDENLYQPRIHSKRIRELHKISEQVGQPMTVLVDMALRRIIAENTSIPFSPLSDGYRQNMPVDASIGNDNSQKR